MPSWRRHEARSEACLLLTLIIRVPKIEQPFPGGSVPEGQSLKFFSDTSLVILVTIVQGEPDNRALDKGTVAFGAAHAGWRGRLHAREHSVTRDPAGCKRQEGQSPKMEFLVP